MEPDGPCAEGLRAVLEQMEAVLARQGAHRIGAAGEQFDPERHEAIAVQPSAELPDRTILAVERSGFALGRPRDPPGPGGGRPRARARALMPVASQDYYEALGGAARRQRRTRSARRTAGSPAATTRTSTRSRAPRTASSRSPRPTRSCATPRSARATTGSARTGGRARTSPARADSSEAFRGGNGFDDVRVEFGGGDFSDFFEGLFGRAARAREGRRAGSRSSRCAAADHEAVLDLALEEAARGGKRWLSLGDGRAFEVDIPRGVRDGQRIRCPGRAAPGAGGGPPGDLFLRVRLRPHPRFRVEGRDLYVDLAGVAVGGGARRRGSGADARRRRPRQGPAGLVQRPPAEAARPGAARQPGGAGGRPVRGRRRSGCRRS